ncbi:MAG TPA: hypothetical protein VJZ94_04035 [Candidatus Paceibacterota bacterium]|nr:hypothetical protein [Candidatus Paceibacterota bacterium]
MYRQRLTPEQASAIDSAFKGREYNQSLLTTHIPPSVLVLSKEAEAALLRAVKIHGTATVHKLNMCGCIILSHRHKRMRRWWEEDVYLEYPQKITHEMENEIIAECQKKARRSFLSYCLGSHEYLVLLFLFLVAGAGWLHSVYLATPLFAGLAVLLFLVLYICYWDKKRMIRQTLRALNADIQKSGVDHNSHI